MPDEYEGVRQLGQAIGELIRLPFVLLRGGFRTPSRWRVHHRLQKGVPGLPPRSWWRSGSTSPSAGFPP